MRIRKLAPSGRVEGRWLCHLEDGTILRLGESEVVAFGLGTGKELDEAELSALTEAARAAQVREKAVELLSVRPLSRKELVEKLTARPRNREKEPLCGREAAGTPSLPVPQRLPGCQWILPWLLPLAVPPGFRKAAGILQCWSRW